MLDAGVAQFFGEVGGFIVGGVPVGFEAPVEAGGDEVRAHGCGQTLAPMGFVDPEVDLDAAVVGCVVRPVQNRMMYS